MSVEGVLKKVDDVETGDVTKPLLAAVEKKEEKLVLFGVLDITHWGETNQAIILAGGALACSLLFAYLQERVFLIVRHLVCCC